MPERFPLSVIVITKDEEANIQFCLESVRWAGQIFIVDSYSCDKTLEIAADYTDKIYQHKFEGYSKQKNWALDNLPISNEWVLSLDADEWVTKELADEIKEVLSKRSNICGYYIKRRVIFMSHWIRYGGYYPIWLLRLFRHKGAHFEDRLMDEHTIVQGETAKLKNNFVDENRKGIHFWIEKLNNFSTLEAISRLKETKEYSQGSFFSFQPKRKKWLKKNFYLQLPSLIRPFLYFFYRYFILLGFLDGTAGLIYHFVQGCWYQLIVDIKMFQLRKMEECVD